uniref:CWC15 spliceosome associated protein homolog n=1 Tax=Sander lucioperca TaxID=283035 RepID=A0A8D0AP49_SANLU
MTTAARPTFEPARGGRGKGEGGGDLSALSKQYSSRDLPGGYMMEEKRNIYIFFTKCSPEVRARDFRRELEERERVAARDKTRERGPREHTTSSSSSSSSKRPRLDQIPAANLDADDPLTDDDEDEDSEEDSDDDDTAALLAELEKIKKERAEEWDDDVVFKNCAKGVDEARKEKRFINDTLRSEFHKKFMEKYVK